MMLDELHVLQELHQLGSQSASCQDALTVSTSFMPSARRGLQHCQCCESVLLPTSVCLLPSLLIHVLTDHSPFASTHRSPTSPASLANAPVRSWYTAPHTATTEDQGEDGLGELWCFATRAHEDAGDLDCRHYVFFSKGT